MGKGKRRKRREALSPWENIQMEWNTPPDRVRLTTDADVSISWPFGDDLAEVMSTLNDEYFEVFLTKAWKLCKEEALNRPKHTRERFLDEQRSRLEGYKVARRAKRCDEA